MMTNTLGEVLKRLHDELAEHPRLDAGTVESLKALATEIQNAIDSQTGSSATTKTVSSPGGASAAASGGEMAENGSLDASLSSRVNQVIEDFEAHHPQLTRTLSMIAERLADMGI
ncbi:MAG: DUF4404 family protein [Pirellula sp.]|nr:DUF4404 family protein [Pirellula sp.]